MTEHPCVLFEDFVPYAEDEEGALLGTASIFGAEFHVTAIRVTDDPSTGEQTPWTPPREADAEEDEDAEDEEGAAAQLWESFLGFEDPDGPCQTIELPGREGRWVLWLVPKSD